MVGMKIGDPHTIVMGLLQRYLERQMQGGHMTKVAESIAYQMAGMKISRRYRIDISEPNRNIVAREFLRGVIADYKAI